MKFFTVTVLCGFAALSSWAQEQPQRLTTPLLLAPEMTDVSSMITPPPALNPKRMAKDLAEVW